MADWRVVLIVEATVVMRDRLMVEMMVLGMASCLVEVSVEWMDDLMVD